MGKTIRLTMAQAVAHFLKAQMTVVDGRKVPIFAGVWAIFGHGNVAGMGEALYQVRGELPTLPHHSLFFTRDWAANFAAIFGEHPSIPDPASIYVCNTST